MKIVFLETKTLGNDVSLEAFEALGEVVRYDLSDPEKNAERAKDADILVVNKIPMNEESLALAKNLKLICLTATGTNNVDFDYVNKRGIAVTNVKGYSTQSVIQHTFAMFFYLYEKLPYYDNFVKSGEYSRNDIFCHFDAKFNELYGKTWGIIGLGEIGRGVAAIAKLFGCRVIYYSTSGKNDNADYERVIPQTVLFQFCYKLAQLRIGKGKGIGYLVIFYSVVWNGPRFVAAKGEVCYVPRFCSLLFNG